MCERSYLKNHICLTYLHYNCIVMLSFLGRGVRRRVKEGRWERGGGSHPTEDYRTFFGEYIVEETLEG